MELAPCSSSNYDENDGFFDHVAPPTPDRNEYPEEFVTVASPPGTPGGGLPVGAGFRVPCIIVSPWTVGGRIFSEVSDHTSGLRLIEAVTAAGGLSGDGPVTFPDQPLARARPSATSPAPSASHGRSRPRPTPSSTPPPRRPTWPPSRPPPGSRCRPAPALPSSSRRSKAEADSTATRHQRGPEGGIASLRPRVLPGRPAPGTPASKRRGGIVVPESVSHFIGGQQVRSALRKAYGVADPATGKDYTQVEVGTAGDVIQAVLAAQAALETGPWPGMTAPERARRPARYRGLRSTRRAGDIAAAEALGAGLPLTQAREQGRTGG